MKKQCRYIMINEDMSYYELQRWYFNVYYELCTMYFIDFGFPYLLEIITSICRQLLKPRKTSDMKYKNVYDVLFYP